MAASVHRRDPNQSFTAKSGKKDPVEAGLLSRTLLGKQRHES
jgi:hypothetical protein